MNEKRDVELMFEVGQLRRINRTWTRFFQSQVANISEHSFRVMWIALMIAKKEGVKDQERLLKMALMHDLVESRTGDVDYISRQYVIRKEAEAVADIFSETILDTEFNDLWKECDERKTLIAKILKDADTLDVDLELREQSIQSVSENKARNRKKMVRPKLFTKTARKYWDIIHKANPHDWHQNGRNRFNSGDWKKGK